MTSIRIVVVDDQDLVRAGFCRLLEDTDGLEVVGSAGNGRVAVDVVRHTKPDVVLMDVRMPELDGIRATQAIVRDVPAARVLILTTFDLDEHVYDALAAGASGFLLKDAPYDQLLHAIRVLAAGDSLLAPSVTRRLIERFARQRPPATASPALGLTEREEAILRLMAEGLSNAEIGDRLYLAEPTVKTHVGRILAKLAVRDRVQAVVFCYRSGLVS